MYYVDDGPSDGPPVVEGTDNTLRKEKDRMTKEQITGGATADLTTLLDRNRSFAEQFAAGNLKISPRMSTILLTCLDARVDPAHLFGLGLGDALVIRNAGGRITPAVMGDLGILSVLAAAFTQPGTSPRQPELVVIHHTDCECLVSPTRPSRDRSQNGSASVSTKYRQWRSVTPPRPCKTTSTDSATPPECQTNWLSPASSTT